ncbi:MAG: hypothetical protein K2N05_06780 [Muribaculaceae bacterium]|nr:hypothetical protein [Muribaculaceae bacterium]
MKRILIILSFTIVALIANAKPPQISVEQFFDGRYNKEKTVSTFFSKDNGEYFRILKVNNNPTIVKKIFETLGKDRAKATRFFEHTGEGGKSVIVKITNNGETIDVGFQQDPSGRNASLFIKGLEKAFK